MLSSFEERERERENESVSKGWGNAIVDIGSPLVENRRRRRRRRTTKNDDDELMMITILKTLAFSPGEHPLPTISKNASSLSSAKYAFAHSNHTRNGANSDWRTPRMSSTSVWGRLCGSIETCSPLSPIGTRIKAIAPTSPSVRCCCVMTESFRLKLSIARSKVCCAQQQKQRRKDENALKSKKEGKKNQKAKV